MYFKYFQCFIEILDQFYARRNQGHRAAGERRQIGGDVEADLAAPVHAADAAGGKGPDAGARGKPRAMAVDSNATTGRPPASASTTSGWRSR